MNKLHHLMAGVLCLLVFHPRQARAQEPGVLTPLPTGYTQLTPPVDPNHFRFVTGGDNRSTGHGTPMPPALDEICRETGILGPDLVIWSGDTILGYGDTDDEATAEYRTFLNSASLTRTPFFNIPGNHELGTKHEARSLEQVYRKVMGPLYGSFNYGNSHFIGFDTTPVENGEPIGGKIDDAQMQWLESDLKANAGAANIFVFMHHYMFGPTDPDLPARKGTGFASEAQRNQLHAVFRRYRVRAVFCGHEHLYWHKVVDGIDYFIAGNAGAPLDETPQNGGFLGYALIEVIGTKLYVKTLQPWTLFERTIAGNNGQADTAVVELDNYSCYTLSAHGIEVTMPTGHDYKVSANATYKGKTKPVIAKLGPARPSADGKTVAVTVYAYLPKAHTTRVTVSP